MGNTVNTSAGSFKSEGGTIRVGSRFGRYARFEAIPTSTEQKIILEHLPDSCLLDSEGEGVNQLLKKGIPRKSISNLVQGLNDIIRSVDWNVDWFNDTKPSCCLLFLIMLHILGVIILVCILVSKNNAIVDKRNNLMEKARTFVKDFNKKDLYIEAYIPQRFTEYIEVKVKSQPAVGYQGSYEIGMMYGHQNAWGQNNSSMYSQGGSMHSQPNYGYTNYGYSASYNTYYQPAPQNYGYVAPYNYQPPQNQTITIQLQGSGAQ